MDRTRDGNMLARTWRGLRGEPVDAELELDIGYSKVAVERLVKRVGQGGRQARRGRRRRPRERRRHARGRPRTGRRVLAKRLKRQVARRLLDVGDGQDRDARRPQVVKPKVTTEELAEKYPAILVVDRANFQLTLYKDLKLAKTYGIAVGQVGLETPGRALPHPEQGGRSRLDVPNSDWVGAGRPRHGGPRRRAREPAQGALAGHLRRRRDPRDRRRRLDRHAPRRTAASACGSPT